MSTTLTAKRVEEIFLACLFQDGEDTSSHVKAEGITTTVEFHSGRLDSHKAEIEAMLDELPSEFKRERGGGMSFLNACMDKHDEQWTGSHRTMEKLFLLGIAIGKVTCLLPKERWSVLPGGMPYYVVS